MQGFKNFPAGNVLPSRVMLRLPNVSMSGFGTKPGLVNKIRLPDCGPVASPRPIQQQPFLSTSISSALAQSLQPGTTGSLAPVLW